MPFRGCKLRTGCEGSFISQEGHVLGLQRVRVRMTVFPAVRPSPKHTHLLYR